MSLSLSSTLDFYISHLILLLPISLNISSPLIALLSITPTFKEKPELFYDANDYPA